MAKPEELSLPALAIYTELESTGELISEARFSEEFPEDDYWVILDALKNAGLLCETTGEFHPETPRGVLFHQRTARPIRID
ncbi:hypothetical protein KUM39_09880 [Streptomyces sp. J2-1]|uniref:hypothetical protein n=1 Tax=Streptomyces corallincola TaxID=2851888 RepID=UPI001C38DE48|nr:hypothetical protein [Streptomyces corallincola]MBV2354669.1 hypothetical protein [Streptomyces corallincola]